jgi:hypothetical protein
VAQDRIDPSEQLPEADVAEQQARLDPRLSDDEPGSLDGAASVEPVEPVEPVDEADRWEQQLPVPSAEDDYPNDRFEAG